MNFFLILSLGMIAFSLGNVIHSDESYYSMYSDETDASFEIEERIFGGIEMNDTSLLKFNYQVGMYIKEKNGDIRPCGGVLVHKEVVLTAAHCLVDAEKLYLFVGVTNKPANLNSPGTIEVLNTSINIHKEYNSDTAENDIAVILLKSTDITLSTTVNIIPIASSTWTTCEVGNGWISGYGEINDMSTTSNKILYYARATPLNFTACNAHYVNEGGLVQGKQICSAGDKTQGTCEGDSGGPYVLEDDKGGRYLCGLVSADYSETCINGDPGIYAAVAYYYDNKWICNNTNSLVGC